MNLREWALPVYTILMQLAVGTLLSLWIVRHRLRNRLEQNEIDLVIRNPILVIVFTTATAMLGAHLHLSKPWLSYLAVINLESSWLSREILVSMLFFVTAGTLWFVNHFWTHKWRLQTILGWIAVFFGLSVDFCISHVYMLPTQEMWNSPLVVISFFITTLLLGIMALVCLLMLDLKYAEFQKPDNVKLHVEVIKQNLPWISGAAATIFLFDFIITWGQLFQLRSGSIVMDTSLRVLLELYSPILTMRLMLLVIAPVILGYTSYRIYTNKRTPQSMMPQIYVSCLMTLVAEILGRFLFYAIHIRTGV